MAEIDKKVQLTAGIFILLLTVGTTYFVMIDDPVYLCEDTQIVGMCFKLSKVNDFGLQTRCYYNESAPTRYKTCKTGWIEFDKTEFIGNKEKELDINLSVESKQILEPYIYNLRLEEYSCKTGYKCYHLFSDKINRMYFVQIEIKNRTTQEIEKEAGLIAKKNLEMVSEGITNRQPTINLNNSIYLT